MQNIVFGFTFFFHIFYIFILKQKHDFFKKLGHIQFKT
jgi:hypothetical protein